IVSNAMLALESLAILPGRTEAPSWLGEPKPFDSAEVLPIRNALVHLPGVIALHPFHQQGENPVEVASAIIAPTPRFFCTYALDFDFNLDADPPAEWFKFLGSLWPDDPESITTLQEWFGYCLLPDTSQHKILMMIGPKRSGRGTIARVMRELIGRE